VDPRGGLDEVEKRKFLTLPGLELRPLGRPARNQSLYRLSYPGSRVDYLLLIVSLMGLRRLYIQNLKERNWKNMFVNTFPLLCILSAIQATSDVILVTVSIHHNRQNTYITKCGLCAVLRYTAWRRRINVLKWYQL
jgi:hypothetical protein